MTKACEPLPTEIVVSRELLEDYKRLISQSNDPTVAKQAKINAVNDILKGD